MSAEKFGTARSLDGTPGTRTVQATVPRASNWPCTLRPLPKSRPLRTNSASRSSVWSRLHTPSPVIRQHP